MLGCTAIASAAQKLILPHRSVSEVDWSEFFNKESFEKLDEKELGTKGDCNSDESINVNNVLICLV